MKFLVVGGGSMGKRRIRCLLANDIEPSRIGFVDTREDRRDEVVKLHGIQAFASVDEGLAWNPAAVIVSVPGVYHLPVMQQAVAAKKHVFCEVPFTTTRKEVDQLISDAKSASLLIAPGSQPMFEPLTNQIRKWVNDPSFGPVLSITEEMGEYLPDWHPYEDYRKFYASDVRMGGCNLDVIAQFLTVQFWVMNRSDVSWLQINGQHLSSLEVKGVDYWQLFGKFDAGPVVNMQYDLFQRAGHYSVKYVSENAIALIDKGVARYYDAQTKQWQEFKRPDDFVYEQCYIDEIACFIDCIKNNGKWPNPISHAVSVVDLMVAMANSINPQEAN